MKKTVLYLLLLLTFPVIAYAAEGQPFKALQEQIDQTNTKLNSIQLTPGPQGPQGPAGPKGDTGAPGPAGATGGTGATGPAGSAGPTGATGAAGAAGPAGPAGPIGPAGVQGPQGIKGDKGDQGIQGIPGPAGATGPKGDKGATGATGATGPQGQAGVGWDISKIYIRTCLNHNLCECDATTHAILGGGADCPPDSHLVYSRPTPTNEEQQFLPYFSAQCAKYLPHTITDINLIPHSGVSVFVLIDSWYYTFIAGSLGHIESSVPVVCSAVTAVCIRP